MPSEPKPKTPGTKRGLDCINHCDHTVELETACWPCIEEAIRAGVAEEREACAKLADDFRNDQEWTIAAGACIENIAAAIRARKEQA